MEFQWLIPLLYLNLRTDGRETISVVPNVPVISTQEVFSKDNGKCLLGKIVQRYLAVKDLRLQEETQRPPLRRLRIQMYSLPRTNQQREFLVL